MLRLSIKRSGTFMRLDLFFQLISNSNSCYSCKWAHMNQKNIEPIGCHYPNNPKHLCYWELQETEDSCWIQLNEFQILL